MKPSAVAVALSLTLFAAVSAHAAGVEKPAAAAKCVACHDVSKKKMGPTFTEISAKYKADPGAQAMLTEGILKGSKGKWGKIPMPPQKVTAADAEALSKWILSL
jgi:cytochrome c